MTRKRRQLFEDLQIEVVEQRRRGHLICRLRNRNGLIRTFTLSVSPSDRRGWLNERAMLRRFADA